MLRPAKFPRNTGTGLLLLLVLVAGLVTYKSAGALHTVTNVQSTGTFSARTGVIPLAAADVETAVSRSVNYLAVIWPALAFGILIAGAVRAFVPATALSGLFDGAPVRAQLAAGASGAPLMLCSCCVAPIFSAVYERSTKLGPSLALMVAAPALNPAALILTFVLFSTEIAWARVIMSLVAVFAGTAVVAWICHARAATEFAPIADLSRRSSGGAEADGPSAFAPAELRRDGPAMQFVKSCLYVGSRTVPLLVIGIVAGMTIAAYLPTATFTSSSATLVTVAATASLAVPIALPTFFEVPLALTMLAAGAPAGAAAALLFAGPAVNLPSLLTVGRSVGWRVAVGLAVMVWLVALAGGLLVS